MILHINDLLNRWAEWSTRRASSGMGYPRQCIYTRMTVSCSPMMSPEIDEEAWAVEQAVQNLKQFKQIQHRVIVEIYLRKGTSEQKAKELGCGRQTMYDRLHQAHISIMDWMNENA